MGKEERGRGEGELETRYHLDEGECDGGTWGGGERNEGKCH